jgi:hypothetical protein
MDQMKKFQDLSKAEMQAIEGGSWLGKAWNWIKKHIGVSGHDMGGNPAIVVTVH